MGKIDFPLKTPHGVRNIYVTLDVVSADVPALLGLDILDKHLLNADTVSNMLVKKAIVESDVDGPHVMDEWSIPMSRADGHVYADIAKANQVCFTRHKLEKLHRQFVHPSADKLFKLLRKTKPEETTPETLKILEDITRRCDPCQRIQPAPVRFRVSLGAEEIRFNEELLMDIMYIGSDPVLHIVDSATRFSAARFLPDVTTMTVWSKFVECWISIYTGMPNRIRVDRGTCFGDNFFSIARRANIDIGRSGVEAHSSLGVGERYHKPLRDTFRKAKIAIPSATNDLILSLSVKAMNDTLGPEGFVPSALVFGEYPSTQTFEEPKDEKPTLVDRAKLARLIRGEMEKKMATLRVQRALRHKVPPAADVVHEIGDQVLVYREKQVNNRIGEWLGPFQVKGVDQERKLVYVQDTEEGEPNAFGFAQVKKYLRPQAASEAFFIDLDNALVHFKSIFEDDDEEDEIFLTEVLKQGDPRCNNKEMLEAKKKEIEGLFKRGTFKVIAVEDIPPDANVLPGRFVLAIKTNDGVVKYKARFVIGGHRDSMKHLIVHISQNIQPVTVRLSVSLASIHDFSVWISDVRQAYLQSKKPLTREIFIKKLLPEFELNKGLAVQLLMPLYGLSESGDHWFETLDDHHCRELGMCTLRSDPAMYVKMKDNQLIGLSGTYVDDILRVGSEEFRMIASKTNNEFEMDDDKELPCTFTGFKLEKNEDGVLQLQQHDYLSQITVLPEDASFSDLASTRMKLAWLSHSRPDCLFEISQLTQITKDVFEQERRTLIRRTNKLIKYAKQNELSLRFPKLDKNSLKIVGFSDASFAGNRDFSSQLGYLIFLSDDSGSVCPVVFKSYKARRVTRSVMGAELIAFSDMFDAAFTLREELRALHPGSSIPLTLYTDSKTLFDVISKGTRTSEKRLMLDIACTREGFKTHAINDIGFIRSSENIADCLTKAMSQASLAQVLKSSKLGVHVEQFIVRDSETGLDTFE